MTTMLKNSKILKKFFIINLPATMSGIQLKDLLLKKEF